MKLCCICDEECGEDSATLSFAIPKPMEPHILVLHHYTVCCPSCAEILINRKEAQAKKAWENRWSNDPGE